jgi:hypothetical protein
MEIKIPTRKEIEDLKPGDLALDCFGKYNEVVEIYAKREDINGRLFACFYTKFGENATISGSYKEDRLIRTIPLSGKY